MFFRGLETILRSRVLVVSVTIIRSRSDVRGSIANIHANQHKHCGESISNGVDLVIGNKAVAEGVGDQLCTADDIQMI